MTAKINFIPIDYDYFDYEGKNYAKIIGRTDTGKRACVIDTTEAYFWAILKKNLNDKQIKKLQNRIEAINITNRVRTSKILRAEVHEKKFLGRDVKVLKIFVTNSKDMYDIAHEINFKEIEKKRELDINFITRYIIERKLNPLNWYEITGDILNNSTEFGGIDSSVDVDICINADKIILLNKDLKFKPKILAYDIETDEFEIGKGEILMISLYGENFKKVLTWKKSSKKDFVENYKSEEEIISKFCEYVRKYNPDILAGYFSDGFDLPYLRARAEKNRIKLNLGLDNSQPIFSKGNLRTGKIRGIVHIDLLRFIRNAYSQYLQSETLSLNEVSKELLEEEKLDFDFDPFNTEKKDIDWDKFYEYNLKDSELTYKLIEKIWIDIEEITKIIKEPLFKVSRSTMASNFEDYVIHNLEQFNEIAEKEPMPEDIARRRERKKYEGAFVLQPIPGLYENVGFFDFSSMYGSVIVSYNLSLSTCSKDEIKNSYVSYYQDKKIYFTKTPGFIPLLLGNIIELRRKAKEEYNQNQNNAILKARSNAFKLIINAAYGYQGFFGARYYCIEAASSAAYFARENIKKAIKSFEKDGFTLIYSDTDSIAVKLDNKSEEQALNTLKRINKNLPGIMELDLDGFFKRGIWVTKRTGEFGAKKKYALIDEKNKIRIRGFETVRRDWCVLTRNTQNKILEFILKEGNEKNALAYLKDIIKKVKKREIPLKELIIKTQLKKSLEEYKSEGPHVTIAKKMKEMGLPVKAGMLIEYYITESKDKKARVRDRALLPNEPGNYDIDYYLKNQILPAVENIFEVLNVNIEEIIDNKKQKSLGDY